MFIGMGNEGIGGQYKFEGRVKASFVLDMLKFGLLLWGGEV